MEKEKVLLQEYETMYINDGKNTIPSIYFRNMAPGQQQAQALAIMRFAIAEYLGWDPEDIKKYLSKKILRKLKLDGIFKSYITFPPEYDKDDTDLTYLAYLLYPERYHLDVKEQCINMFERIYNGEIDKFPSAWISTGEGLLRFSIILQYVIAQLPRFKDQEALYAYFATQGIRCFKKYRIYSFATALYDTPLDALHFSLPDELKSDFWYHYFKFNKTYAPPRLKKNKEGVYLRKAVERQKTKNMTNADRIKSMSNEELADFLLKINCAYPEPCMTGEEPCKWANDPVHGKGCKDCFLAWLEANVEE